MGRTIARLFSSRSRGDERCSKRWKFLCNDFQIELFATSHRKGTANSFYSQTQGSDFDFFSSHFIAKVKKHFSRYISNENQEGEVWFDCNNTPLKWHYPIGNTSLVYVSKQLNLIALSFLGVLYDLTMRENEELPWTITIHFSKFPEEILFHCPNR